MPLILILWYISIIVSMFLNYGTAYRLTRNGGDNGIALFGWFFALAFAGIVPGLCIWLWFKHKEI